MVTPIVRHEDTPFVNAPYDGDVAIGLYGLVLLSSGKVVPASSEAWDTDLATTQGAAAPKFLGISAEDMTADAPADDNFSVIHKSRVEMDCTSSTFQVGDFVSFAANAGGDGLENHKVAKTATKANAIGVVTKHYGSNTTRVEFEIISRVLTKDLA